MEERQRGVASVAAASKRGADLASKPPPIRFYIPLNIALCICVISHTFAAFRAPIQDCDETYNYWEPLHYLNHGSGLQTWEYSPEFSIRSWAYILVHAIPTKITGLLVRSKTAEFYGLRVVFALVCAATETKLYSAICRTLNPRIGVFYLMVVAFTPGFFYASVAFLPSSFAMYTSTLGLTAFMDWHGGPKTATGIMWFGLGALLGWPFAGALIIPFVLEDWLTGIWMNDAFSVFTRYLDGFVRCLIILALQVSIDAFFYHEVVLVPLKIVLYNVFSGSSRGPDIFGTELWHYYVRNLLLNFNLFFVLALASFPFLAIQSAFFSRQTTKQTLLRTTFLLSPFYLWLTIFTLQPHKEERFMYPVYPFLALNAAISLHMLLTWLGTSSTPSSPIGRIPARLKLTVVLLTLLAAINLSLLRILGTVTAYQAPLQIYAALPTASTNDTAITNVCHGRTWHHFPTSHLLPSPNYRPAFIRSAFRGLLPGRFSEAHTGFGFWPGTHLVPAGMNDLNREDPGKYTDIAHCEYLVDVLVSLDEEREGHDEEPPFVKMQDEWERVRCEPWLHKERSGGLGRVVWTPGWQAEGLQLPSWATRRWGEFCLLRRKRRVVGEGKE